LAIKEPELTPIDLSPNWFALAYCILTKHDPAKVLDKALMKFDLSGAVKPDTAQPKEPKDPAAAILSIIKRRKS